MTDFSKELYKNWQFYHHITRTSNFLYNLLQLSAFCLNPSVFKSTRILKVSGLTRVSGLTASSGLRASEIEHNTHCTALFLLRLFESPSHRTVRLPGHPNHLAHSICGGWKNLDLDQIMMDTNCLFFSWETVTDLTGRKCNNDKSLTYHRRIWKLICKLCSSFVAQLAKLHIYKAVCKSRKDSLQLTYN